METVKCIQCCFKTFSQRSGLQIHKQTCSVEKPNECHQCTEVLFYHIHLQIHKRTCSEEKCSDCK